MFFQIRNRAESVILAVTSGTPSRVLPPMQFEIIDDGTLNAFADLFENRGYVVLNRGSILAPLEAFTRMLSHPESFPQIGNPKLETVSELHADGLNGDFDRLMSSRHTRGLPSWGIPKDQIRAAFASLIARTAVDFLVGHEIGHILLGHCGYLQSIGIPLILEAETAETAYGDPLTRQAMELEADRFGADLTMSELMQFATDQTLPETVRPFMSSKSDVVFIWTVAVLGLFHFWGFGSGVHKAASAFHPPPALRFRMIEMSADQHAQGFETSLGEGDRSQADIQLLHALQLIGHANAGKVHLDGVIGSRTADARQHMNAVIHRLNDILNELSKFRYLL